jgi:hypothetical protein
VEPVGEIERQGGDDDQSQGESGVHNAKHIFGIFGIFSTA